MDPAVEWLEAEYDANPQRPYGANGRTGVAWVRRIFELKGEAHQGQQAPVCTCYLVDDSDFLFAASLPPMNEEETAAWLKRSTCVRPVDFQDRQHAFFKKNGFKNNLIEE